LSKRIHLPTLLSLCAVIFILLAETAQSENPKFIYYLYEESDLASRNCLRHAPLESARLENQSPVTLSSVVQGCRVFEFRADGTIRATTSITDPKPTDWCIDAATGQGNDGDLIQLVRCHGQSNQLWRKTEKGILRGVNDKCIVRGDKQEVVLGPCEQGIRWRPQGWTPD
jgi:hypothetical protein